METDQQDYKDYDDLKFFFVGITHDGDVFKEFSNYYDKIMNESYYQDTKYGLLSKPRAT